MKVIPTLQALLDLGMRQEDIADAVGVKQGTISRWLKGQDPGGENRDKLAALAKAENVHIDEINVAKIESNARIGARTPLGGSGATIPVYGQAIGGLDGRFVLNGNKIADVLAPPSLIGIPDAYAVYIVGDSMEPRYFAGETVYVHPRLPVRKGDFVVIQFRTDGYAEGEAPSAYAKQLVSMDGKRVRLKQFNPDKAIELAADRIISIHKIVGSGS